MKRALVMMIALLTLSACSERALLQEGLDTTLQENTNGIVGGMEADPWDEHIEHTVLVTGKYENGRSYVCTGTLITRDIILTAAHCVGRINSMRITFGEAPLQTGAIEILKVKAVLPHIDYQTDHSGLALRNDIALIQMESPGPENFAPAILPWNSPANIGILTSVRVYGYGVTSGRLQAGKLDTRSAGVLRTTQLKISKGKIQEDFFTASQREGRGICVGDSGGPAFVLKNVIVGVISRGVTDDPNQPQKADNDLCNYESIFTRVSYYQTWIENGIKALSPNASEEGFTFTGP